MAAPPVWTAPSAVLHSRPRQLTTSINPGTLLMGRMMSPTIAGPDLCYGPRFHVARQLRLQGEMGHVNQELWDTSPDNSVVHGRTLKANERLSTGTDPTGPRPLPPEPPELVQIGAKFNETRKSTSATTRPGYEKTRGRHQRSSLVYKSKTSSPHMLGAIPPENALDPTTPRDGAGSYAPTYGGQQAHRLAQANSNGNRAQSHDIHVSPPKLTDRRDPELLLQTSPGPNLRAPARREYPDLFYGFKPADYAAYKLECSDFYPTLMDFMRRGLEKHRNHLEREGISLEVFELAKKVPPPRGIPIEEKIEQWYLQTRHAFFGTPITEPIIACENAGNHAHHKGTRSRRKPNFETKAAGKRPKISSASPPTSLAGTSFNNPDFKGNAVWAIGVENAYSAMPGTFQRPLPTPNANDEHQYTTGTQGFPDATNLGQPSMTYNYSTLGQQIQQIYDDLSMIYYSFLANSTADTPWEHTTSFEHIVQQMTNSLDTYLSHYPGAITLPATNNQLSGPLSGSHQTSTTSASARPNNLFGEVHVSSSSSILTPDQSTLYSANSHGNVSAHQGHLGFPDHGLAGHDV